jgi:NADPH-ferrihemoprotein reductase
LDINALPRTHILSALAQYAADPAERTRLERMSLTAHKHEYLEYIVHAGRNLRQVLEDHPSVRIMPDAEQVVLTTASADGQEQQQTCKYLTVGDLLELMPILQCRYYSISSSARQHPGRVHITAAVARYRTPLGREGFGVATGYLHRLCHSEAYRDRQGLPDGAEAVVKAEQVPAKFRLPVFVRTSTFRLPKNMTRPIVMIGPVCLLLNLFKKSYIHQ